MQRQWEEEARVKAEKLEREQEIERLREAERLRLQVSVIFCWIRFAFFCFSDFGFRRCCFNVT